MGSSPASDYSDVKVVIFDFDGTLTTYRPVMIEAIRKTLKILRIEKSEDELLSEFRNHLKAGMRDLPSIFRAMLEAATSRRSDEVWRLFVNTLMRLIEETGPPEGVREALEGLRGRGIRLAIVSFRRRELLKQLLSRMSWERFFDVIITPEDVRRFKPNQDPFLKVAEALKVRPEECIVVGDEPADILGGKTAGMRTIGVLTGMLDRTLLEELGPSSIITSVVELQKLLD